MSPLPLPEAKLQQNNFLSSQFLNSSSTVNNSSDLPHNQHPYQQRPSTVQEYVIDAAGTFSISIDTLIKAAAVERSQTTTKKLFNKKNSYRLVGEKVTKITNHSSTFPRDNFNSQLPLQSAAFAKKKKMSMKEPSISTETISNNTISPNSNTKMNKISNTIHKQYSYTQPTPLSYYPLRILTLFLLGSLTSLIIDHLLTQNKHTTYPSGIVKLVDTAIWIPPTCGFSAVLVGTLFPLADYWCAQKPQEFQRDWSNVMRCTGGFIGVAYAATKLPWNSNSQVSLTLALISVVLWFLFDRTIHGFLMSLLFSSVGTGVIFTNADFFGVRSWIPCILYSSCICFGTFGRQLMIVPESWFDQREQKILGNHVGKSATTTRRA